MSTFESLTSISYKLFCTPYIYPPVSFSMIKISNTILNADDKIDINYFFDKYYQN